MRLATYNLLKGGTKRVHWTKLVQEHGVDLLLVQESYHPAEHLSPVRYPTGQDQSVWEMVPERPWGSAVFSGSGTVKPLRVPGFSGWVVGAKIKGAAWQVGRCDCLLAFSIHAPVRHGSYAKPVNQILDKIKRLVRGREIILGGDFNLTVSHYCRSARPLSKQDLAIQARLTEEFGLLNCWQTANPDQPLSQTLRWTGNRTIPYHCDGLFVPKSWREWLQTCSVLTGTEWNLLSDHNPVLASFS
jgi:hypothetical protein